ncbi:MAG: hypothetical protein L0216_05650 [Planctomycetales bacterium]|nr:hypothetical protein [Planctomycetales bacterium]
MAEEPERRKVRATVREVERYREGLIRKYVKFTDEAERWNDKAYRVSLEIEHVNLVLKTAKEMGIIPPEWKKPAGNGKAPAAQAP